jgi:hemolysin III
MSGGTQAAERPQSLGEEITNAISHGVGALGAIVALPVLIVTPKFDPKSPSRP